MKKQEILGWMDKHGKYYCPKCLVPEPGLDFEVVRENEVFDFLPDCEICNSFLRVTLSRDGVFAEVNNLGIAFEYFGKSMRRDTIDQRHKALEHIKWLDELTERFNYVADLWWGMFNGKKKKS